MKFRTLLVAGFLCVFLAPKPASAASISFTYTTGGATICAGGPSLPCTLTSTDSTFSILRLVLDTPIAFADLTNLTTNYDAILGGIGAGSPRWSVVVDTNGDLSADGSFDIHWGPAGTFVDPTLGLGTTGNILSLLDNGRYDLTNIGGFHYTDRAAALALAGGYTVLRLSLVIDSFGGTDRAFRFGAGAFTVDGNLQAVPEPASLLLMGLGLAGVAAARRRARR